MLIEGEIVEKRPRGRPKNSEEKRGRPCGDKYDPAMAEEFITLRENGSTMTQAIYALGKKYGFRSRQTFYNWIKDHPDLAEADEWGYTGYKAWLEGALVGMSVGGVKGDSKACLVLLNNSCNRKSGYNDEWEYNPNGVGNNITINGNLQIAQTMQQITTMPNSELENRINELQAKQDQQKQKELKWKSSDAD